MPGIQYILQNLMHHRTPSDVFLKTPVPFKKLMSSLSNPTLIPVDTSMSRMTFDRRQALAYSLAISS